MIKVTERALEFATKTCDVIRVIREVNDGNDGDLPITARENLIKVRMILKSALKQIDEIFGVQEVD